MKPELISSTTNAKFKIWSSLLESRGIKEHGLCLLSGPKILKDSKATGTWLGQEGMNLPEGNSFFLSKELFEQIDVLGTHGPILVTPTSEIRPWIPEAPQGLELVVPLQDPANLGAVIRSAAAFRAKVILTAEAANPFLPKSLRASSGLSLTTPLYRGPSLSAISEGLGLDEEGLPLNDVKLGRSTRFVLGLEGKGLPSSFKGPRVKIPMSPTVDSLNATVAASLLLFAYRQVYPLDKS